MTDKWIYFEVIPLLFSLPLFIFGIIVDNKAIFSVGYALILIVAGSILFKTFKKEDGM